jgi:Domain of unknown function (DUF5134)
MTPVSMFFTGLLGLGALMCIWRLLAREKQARGDVMLADRESNVVHLVMNAGMALMLTPLNEMYLRNGIIAAYSLVALVLAGKIAIRLYYKNKKISNPENSGLGGTLYHLIALTAMIYAALALHGDVSAHNAHVVSGGMAHAAGGQAEMTNWKAQALGYLFGLDALLFASMVFLFHKAVMRILEQQKLPHSDALPTVGQLRIGILPHIIMDAGMVYMLLVPSAMAGSM